MESSLLGIGYVIRNMSELVSVIAIIGKFTPVKSFICDLLLCGLINTKQSGILAVFLKHLKNIIALQNRRNRLYTEWKYTSSSTFSLYDTNSANFVFVM